MLYNVDSGQTYLWRRSFVGGDFSDSKLSEWVVTPSVKLPTFSQGTAVPIAAGNLSNGFSAKTTN